MNNPARTWHPFDQGSTIGTQGSESGVIVLDEEHPDGARITLERSASVAPIAITCGIYGWFFHTRFLGDEAEAKSAFEEMKTALAQILAIPDENRDAAPDELRDRYIKSINDFAEKFPT